MKDMPPGYPSLLRPENTKNATPKATTYFDIFSTYGPGLVSRDLTFPKTVQKVSEHNSKMPNLRNVRECLLFGFEENPLNDEEFILLYDMNISKNPDFPYWQYDPFDLDGLCDDECKAEFPFLKNNIHLLKDVLQVPEEVVCYNRLVVDGIEDLCVLLKQFAYPICYSDMCPRSATPVPLLSIPVITNCWGFVDGTVSRVCRLEIYRGDYIMGTKGFMLSSSNQWLPLMD